MGYNVHVISFSTMLTKPFQDKDVDSHTMNLDNNQMSGKDKVRRGAVRDRLQGG
jgi:hypothetical protein